MPYNSETETFYQAPATVVDSTPDGDTVQEGFDDRLTPAMAGVYTDLNLLKENGMIGVGIPATTTARGYGRVVLLSDMAPGAEITNGPALVAAGSEAITPTPTAYAIPQADADGKIDPRWCGTASRMFPSFNASEPDALLCNGGEYSRTTYANLFAVIGTSFGDGDGTTTFNVPDMRGRVLQGASGNLKQYITAGLPELMGELGTIKVNGGAFYNGVLSFHSPTQDQWYNNNIYNANSVILRFKASDANNIYGNSASVQPPAIGVNFFIKY